MLLAIRSLGRRLASHDAAQSASPNQLITIKDSCLNRLKQILDKPSEEFLRVHVETGGCSGFSYLFEIEKQDSINPKEDLVFQRDNYRVVISKDVLPFMKGASVEYNESLIKSSFHVSNPIAETKCSCGVSFSVDLNKLQQKQE